MPTRRQHRTGARDGAISAELARTLLKDAHTLGSAVDPVDRVKTVNDFFAQLDTELEQFAEVRLEAIAELRTQGWSYDRIAAQTGLSKARVAQLSRTARGLVRRRRRT